MNETTFEKLAQAAQRSDDLNTQTSAILATPEGEILISGSNTLTKGVEPLPERRQRPGKLPWIEHSERNVVFEAARKGIATEGAHMHMRWFPCVECARAIAQSGISVLYSDPEPEDHPQYQFAAAAVVLKKAGIELRPVGTGPKLGEAKSSHGNGSMFLEDAILDHLSFAVQRDREKGGDATRTTQEIADRAGVDIALVRRTLNALASEDRITKYDDNSWSLPDALLEQEPPSDYISRSLL